MGEYGEFENILKSLRESAGLTQDELSKKTNISRSNIAMYETGMRKPSKKTLEAFADFFNVNIDYLLGRTQQITRLPQSGSYYYDPKANEIAEMLRTNPNYRVLFDAARDSSPEDLLMAAELLNRFKQTNPDG